MDDAWNPGLQSDIPSALWPLVTLFRVEHAYVSHSEALELSDLTGLNVLDLVSLRPERLLAHSLLVRVTADLSVPDGPNYEDLGINLRGMVTRLYQQHMQAELPAMTEALEQERQGALCIVLNQLATQFAPTVMEPTEKAKNASFFSQWFGRPKSVKRSSESVAPEIQAISYWEERLCDEQDTLQKECFKTLIKTVSVIAGHRGRMLPDHDLVARIVVNSVSNTIGSEVADQFVEKHWQAATESEGYRLLPVQEKPFIMNVKGASASGKSTIRPQQRQLAEKLGIPWGDFALISPDYWRKYLLDYSSLGENYKYGAMLTGWELEIIDKKLDKYMASKASNGKMSHLLIDRFRFDSFTVDVDRAADSTLLSRFGDQVFLFFMVTHPSETVSRAWVRGQKTGRYKAVDDLLHHNVEAFTGMPSLFLSWVNSTNKRIHFEFLDNDVPEGNLPKTAAFGWNKTLVILDVNLVLNIDRYRKVNIAAKQPDAIFLADDLVPQANTSFIQQCACTVKKILFADQDTAVEYAVVREGEVTWWDFAFIENHPERLEILAVLESLGYKHQAMRDTELASTEQIDIEAEQRVTVGQWFVER